MSKPPKLKDWVFKYGSDGLPLLPDPLPDRRTEYPVVYRSFINTHYSESMKCVVNVFDSNCMR